MTTEAVFCHIVPVKITFKESNKPVDVTPAQWNDWTWQLRHSLKSADDFKKYFQLTSAEQKAFDHGQELFNIRTTPYYAQLAQGSEHHPLRKY